MENKITTIKENSFFDTYHEEETNFIDDKLTVNSFGFTVITNVLEDLFEQFGFVRFPDKNNVEDVTHLDADLETVFSDTRLNLVVAFNDAVERLQEEQEESDRLDARLGGAIHK
tara:strand:- start:8169 stop:8510 length:342 start_codon:yes stop_codon:yes gene_type:complete